MTEKKYTFSLGVVLLAAAIGLLCGVLLSPRTSSDTPSGLMVPVFAEEYRRFIMDCGGEIDERFFLKD